MTLDILVIMEILDDSGDPGVLGDPKSKQRVDNIVLICLNFVIFSKVLDAL